MRKLLSLGFVLSLCVNMTAVAEDKMPPTHANVKYGENKRHLMDVYLAKSNKPTPVLVWIHGGGFRVGDKNVNQHLLKDCLDHGISLVSIIYRFSDEAIAPASFLDGARAIQFIRHNAKEWNIDPMRIASSGSSAGAGISLWLAFHDDLADPNSADPVLCESTRLKCAAVSDGQCTYDPRVIKQMFPGTNTYLTKPVLQLFGVEGKDLDNLPPEKAKIMEECAPINHVTKDDPPVLMIYKSDFDTPITTQGIGIHHPKFGTVLKEKMAPLGIECTIITKTDGDGRWKPTVDFVRKQFGVE